VEAKRSWIALAAGLVGLAIPASADAATQIGQTGSPDAACGNDLNLVQAATGGAPSYAVPAGGGVITSWSYQGYPSDPGSAKLIVWRPTNVYYQFSVVGKSATEAFSAALQTFATRIPVQAGDLIGLSGDIFSCLDFGTLPGDLVRYNATATEPPDGSTQTLGNTLEPYRILVAASVEPDCDQDGFGDETQDPDTSSCNPTPPKVDRTLTLDANKNKVKKGKKVTLSGHLDSAEQACESGQAVELQRKRPKQTAFTTFAQLQTDAQGDFSLKKKLKKTSEFRAQAAETATCAGQASNTEKVKVRKEK